MFIGRTGRSAEVTAIETTTTTATTTATNTGTATATHLMIQRSGN